MEDLGLMRETFMSTENLCAMIVGIIMMLGWFAGVFLFVQNKCDNNEHPFDGEDSKLF